MEKTQMISEALLRDLMYELDIENTASDDAEGDYYTWAYSGRGMYGDRCVGIVCGNPARTMFRLGQLLGSSAHTAAQITPGQVDAFSYPQQDSMGLSTIVYFSQLSVELDAYEHGDPYETRTDHNADAERRDTARSDDR